MTFGDISALHRRDFVLRRDIEEAMAAFVAANVKKSEQATV